MESVQHYGVLIREHGWSFGDFLQVLGGAVIDESFHRQFNWFPFTNGVAAEWGNYILYIMLHGFGKQSFCQTS